MPQYIGILDGKGNVWGIRIPDVPGCHGGGETPEAALADAISALREVAAHHADNDTDIAPPRRLDEVTSPTSMTICAALTILTGSKILGGKLRTGHQAARK